MGMKRIMASITVSILAITTCISLANPAGVLPISSYNGRVVVLLGEDSHRRGCFTDFGGKADPGEQPYQTAAREFSEESLKVLNNSISSVAQTLKGASPIINGGYYIYPYKVSFVSSQKLRGVMNGLIKKMGGLRNVIRKYHAEKIDFAWVYATDLYNAISKAYNNTVRVNSISGRSLLLYPYLTKGLRLPAGLNLLASLVKNNIASTKAALQKAKAPAKPVAKSAPKKAPARFVAKPVSKKAPAKPVAKSAAKKAPAKPVGKPAPKKAPVKSVAKPVFKKASAKPVAKPVAPKVSGIKFAKSLKVGSATIHIGTGDIAKVAHVGAIVNAANEKLLGGHGINGAVQKAAGPQLLAYCKKNIKEVKKGVRCPTGQVRTTPAFNLSKLGIKNIIHAVGPRGSNKQRKQLLESTYKQILAEASKHKLTSVAIPAISTGIFGFPIKEATEVALKATKNYLQTHKTSLQNVYFVLFSQGDLAVYTNMLAKI